MAATGWLPADPITLRSSIRIVADTVLRRPDEDAPVSNLFLFSRKQDPAFEQPVEGGPRHRHHVRFWRWNKLYEGRPAWIGAVTYDERAGFSHTIGQVTHHISPDFDAERSLANELQKAGVVLSMNGTMASTPSSKDETAAVILGTPMVDRRS
jgi:hypothetical protein